MPRQMVFDYVIVGGGSAGCVLANRLSAGEQNRVCLLEAGPTDWNPLIRMPAGIGYLVPGAGCNQHHFTEPQERLNGRRLFWPRGRTLGGSSAINAMIYMRGNCADYDDWEAAGNPGWGWRSLLPYFLLAEGNERGSDAYHSGYGPLAVSDLKWKTPVGAAFVRAGQSAGHPLNNDFNGSLQDGVGFYQVTQKHGRRCSSAAAYLHPVRNRSNLSVFTHSQAARLLFRGDRVCGVQLLDGRRILTNGEVLLCAGAIQSPQLLLLSGIGPGAELKKAGIVPQAHLPGVGKNLQDHLDITQVVEASAPVTFSNSLWPKLKTALHLPEYWFAGRGPLTNNVAEAGGFACSSRASGRPDIQFHLTAAPLFQHGLCKPGGYGYSLHACALRPKSRGEITLASGDPRALPLIHPNYLGANEDQAVLAEGLEMAREILLQPALQRYHKRWWSPDKPLKTQKAIGEFIARHAETIYHPAGTCKMGADEMAVVDAQLKVHGVDGLRVVDASIMPALISGNTNAPVIAIAEKAADSILQRQQKPLPAQVALEPE
ncbi:GMC family oxidoreductase [Microbulbifer rhizosphaerae]|uniref:Choline dehydrogenase-like flavoprotein n=1 Tax=Microbulbifer rhizosphaerae TaxID=1562603 RepID=A0A7W4ZAW1_9GAMM|nr:GMC family oxidoreductase N-terminal domain-containing protein [Microbulbifer rhizosphaerae]MBB3062981.1 choline dehydrogenase-like flavoprotein [Microbulbifer rhizosphaerae]